jgi:putative hemolysin
MFALSALSAESLTLLPWLAAMVLLLFASAMFSASEAAYFSLRWRDRRALRAGNTAQQLADGLLNRPDLLLSVVLFWNLVVNVTYFTIASIVGLYLRNLPARGPGTAWAFSAAALLTIIFLGEMLPKSIAVLHARRLAALLAVPLTVAVRLAAPLIRVLQGVQLTSLRLFWPSFQPEPLLHLNDLERAVEMSTSDSQLIEHEKAALRNIVLLSDIRVDEWMRPRTQFRLFRPPVSLKDLGNQLTPSGYLLITSPHGEDVVGAVPLTRMAHIPQSNLERYADDVVILPWISTVADAWDALRRQNCQVAAIVNEFGETIGILTLDDILDTVFAYQPSRSRLLLGRKPIHDLAPGKWLVAGITSLRRFERYLQMTLPPSKSVTMAGVVQEELQRLATAGDRCRWGDFELKVIEAPQRGHMLIEVTLLSKEGEKE